MPIRYTATELTRMGVKIDELPFGAMQLNFLGDVIAYNATEERRSGYPREKVLGRNFFRDIAPCANVRAFLEPFQRAVLGGTVVARFDYIFDLPTGRRDVEIYILSDPSSGGPWVLADDLAGPFARRR